MPCSSALYAGQSCSMVKSSRGSVFRSLMRHLLQRQRSPATVHAAPLAPAALLGCLAHRQNQRGVDGAERGNEVAHVRGKPGEEGFAADRPLIHVEAAVDLDLQPVATIA